MTVAVDLATYLARIGFDGRPAADLATLRRLHALHPAAIAFENLNPLIGRPVPLDLASLEAKLVRGRRGGYCFEQNTLLEAVLGQIGFPVVSLGARVEWNAPPGLRNARNHMVLRVDLPEGAYLCDVGFGGLTLTAPLRLAADAEQDTPHGVHRLLAVPHGFRLQVRLAGGWESIYRFTLEEQAPLDWKVSNYFISTHVDSVFTQTLMAARPLPGLRYALRGPQLAVYGADGTVERQVLASGDEIAAALDQTFDLDVPDEAGPFLDRIAKAGA